MSSGMKINVSFPAIHVSNLTVTVLRDLYGVYRHTRLQEGSRYATCQRFLQQQETSKSCDLEEGDISWVLLDSQTDIHSLTGTLEPHDTKSALKIIVIELLILVNTRAAYITC